MELGGLKTIAIPQWVKVLVAGIVLAAVAANLVAIYVAVTMENEWFPASLTLFGSLMPIILLVLLLALSRSGFESLQTKTAHLLLDEVPSLIKYAATPVPPFSSLDEARSHRDFAGDTQVRVAYHPGDFYVRYRIEFPDVWSDSGKVVHRVAYLVVDLKVHEANMHLCVPKERLDEFCDQTSRSRTGERWLAFGDAFHHTLTGAERAGCRVNDTVLELELEGTRLSAVIVVRPLATDFLHEPAEQLYTAQDLTAMLRGFWRERTSWFPEFKGS